MEWVRLDSSYFTNPKIASLTPGAQALHIASICWCGMHSPSGHLPPAGVRVVLGWASAGRPQVARLLAAGLWEPNGSGFVVHDFDTSNGSKSAANVQREQARERQRRHRERERE